MTATQSTFGDLTDAELRVLAQRAREDADRTDSRSARHLAAQAHKVLHARRSAALVRHLVDEKRLLVRGQTLADRVYGELEYRAADVQDRSIRSFWAREGKAAGLRGDVTRMDVDAALHIMRTDERMRSVQPADPFDGLDRDEVGLH